MATEGIPTYNSLTDVYGRRGCKEAIERYAKLNETFQQLFGTSPEAFARSPGRVNLIGEHIDYEGYAVLPMAIRQAVDVDNHCWGNYFVAAYKGVFEHWQSKQGGALPVTGLQVLVDGNVPTAAGLSSSSAMVCACALAVLGVHGQSLTKSEVAEFTCTCERYVGVTSGGMDQAISIMASPGTAKMVEFAPVRATDVQLPAGATFVVANSLAVSAKADTAAGRYNLRVLECRLAAAVLGKQLGAAADRAAALNTLLLFEITAGRTLLADGQQHQEVEPLAEAWWTGSPASRSEVCCHAAQQLLHEEAYGEAEVESAIGMPLTQLLSDSPVSLASVAVARERGGFRLRQRALHVYGEAARVHAFRKACNVHSSVDASATMETLGRLMDESHGSCSQLYECSCPELEELVSVCRSAGALGSRLTGAGWGGCTVSLVREEDAEAFISAVKQRYYQPLVEKGIASTDLLDLYVFASQPAGGGAVLQLPAEALEAAQ